MNTYTGIPTLIDSQTNANNGISQVIINLARHLPKFGWQYTPRDDADLRVHHAGEGGGQTDIAVVHGLHPTGDGRLEMGNVVYQINKRIIADVIAAKRIVVPSAWVAETFQRDMHVTPDIIGWGINLDEWQHTAQPQGYVLWNKNRADAVCNPVPLNKVAAALTEVPFITTFGEVTRNVRVTGRLLRDDMRRLIHGASVYLATTKETGDIGSREALASGVPVVAFAHGAVQDIVKHGVNGVLVAPNDIDGLAEGIRYVLRNRDILSANARQLSAGYGWDSAARKMAIVMEQTLTDFNLYKVAVIIPHYNYGAYLKECLASVISNEVSFNVKVIIVDDASTDAESLAVLEEIERDYDEDWIEIFRMAENSGVAAARNFGASQVQADYLVFLDADDRIAPNFLRTVVSALDADPRLGIAYTAIQTTDGLRLPWPPPDFNLEGQLQHDNQIPTCSAIRYEDFRRVGGYRGYMQPSEDADLFTRILIYSGKSARRVTDATLFHYRIHEGSLSRQSKELDPYRSRPTLTAYEKRPFAVAPNPRDNRPSSPYRNYDAPLVSVVIEGEDEAAILLTLDSLENQTMPYWVAFSSRAYLAPFVRAYNKDEVDRSAPLTISLEAGTWLPPNALERGLSEGILSNSCCGGTVVRNDVRKPVTDDMVLIVYESDKQGYHPVVGPATRARYQMRRSGERFFVYLSDHQTDPHRFMAVPEAFEYEVQQTIETPPAPQALSVDVAEEPPEVAPAIVEESPAPLAPKPKSSRTKKS